MSERYMPDFKSWPTSRLEFMLDEYNQSIPSIHVLYGRKSRAAIDEEKLYREWIAAIEEQLAKRKHVP